MSDKKGVPSRIIKLDREYELKFGFAAQRRYKQHFGVTIEEAVAAKPDKARALTEICAMLQSQHPKIERGQVARMLDRYYVYTAETFSVEVAINALWVMLLEENKDIQLDDVPALLDAHYDGPVSTAVEKISEIVVYSVTGKTKEEVEAEAAKANPTKKALPNP